MLVSDGNLNPSAGVTLELKRVIHCFAWADTRCAIRHASIKVALHSLVNCYAGDDGYGGDDASAAAAAAAGKWNIWE